jgi:F0F1-type ATP synthase membrane subunit b/b'
VQNMQIPRHIVIIIGIAIFLLFSFLCYQLFNERSRTGGMSELNKRLRTDLANAERLAKQSQDNERRAIAEVESLRKEIAGLKVLIGKQSDIIDQLTSGAGELEDGLGRIRKIIESLPKRNQPP